MNENGKKDEDSVYEDLPDFHLDETITKLEESNCNLQNRLVELENVILDLNEEIKTLHLEKSALKSENATLSTNISSLYKTAVAEVNRKDNIINELRKENFSFLKSKRLEAASKNGSRNSAPTIKDQDRGSHSFSNRCESNETGSLRNRSRATQNNNDRERARVRRRSYSNERRRSKSHSPHKNHSHRSKNLKNSKLESTNSSRSHHLKLSRSDVNSAVSSQEKSSAIQEELQVTSKETMCATALCKAVEDKTPTANVKSEIEKNGKGMMEKTTAKAPVRKFDTTFNKNLVVVDKSVPNTIYTKRLRKRILDQMAKETEALNKPPTCENKKTATLVDSETVDNLNNAAPTIAKAAPVDSCQNLAPVTPKIHTMLLNVSNISIPLSENVETQCSVLSVGDKQTKPIPINNSEQSINENNNSRVNLLHFTSPLTNSVSTIENCNNEVGVTCISNVTPNLVPQNNSIPSAPEDTNKKCIPNDVTSNNDNANSFISLGKDEREKSESILSTINASDTPAESEPKLFASSMNSIAPSSQSNSLHTSSLSVTSSSSHGHSFKKFKKDGKTRINPIYIGPRILTQKKSERKNTNVVRPVLSQYSNLTSLKNPKASSVKIETPSVKTEAPVVLEKIQNKTEEPSIVENRIFSLFGKTPEKCQPFFPSNSQGTSSDNSITNFSFFSSESSPNVEKKSHPEIIVKIAPSPSDELNKEVSHCKQDEFKNSHAANEPVETLQSREEQMASLFGDVSSDSSSDSSNNETASEMKDPMTKFDGNKYPKISPVSQALASEKSSLPTQPEAEIVVNHPPKTAFMPKASISTNNKSSSKSFPRTSPNISDSSLAKMSFDHSQVPSVCTPFKNTNEYFNLNMFTPAREILSPIPSTPQTILDQRDTVTQNSGGNLIVNKNTVLLEKTNERDCISQLSAHEISSLPIQPKAEIIQNYLPKNPSPPDVSANITEKTMKSLDSSSEVKSLDLSKIPDMHTPFKNTNNSSSLIMCTPAQEILSPIPATPQILLDKGSSVLQGKSGVKISEKSESSDDFKIIKTPNSSTLPVIVKKEASKVKIEESVLLSNSKTSETGPAKNDVKSVIYEDANSNLSMNSGFLDRKVFLSPNSVSVSSICCTPFKTFSSDSLQSFMHTPARELLSPIPRTPLGSWEIDIDKTNSCDIVLENNPHRNIPSDKEFICVRDNVMHKSDDIQNGPILQVSSPPLMKEEKKSFVSPDKYFIIQKEKTDIEMHSVLKPENVSIDKTATIVPALEDFSSYSCILSDDKHKTEAISDLPINLCNKPECSVFTSEHDKNQINHKSSNLSLTDKSDIVSPSRSSSAVLMFTPVRSNISENNISISSVSEQIQFQRTSKKVRKVVVFSNANKSSTTNIAQSICSNPSISDEKMQCSASANTSKNDLKEISQPCFKSPRNHNLSLDSFNEANIKHHASSISPRKRQASEEDQLSISCNKIALHHSPPKCRRAVLIPTDIANNIVRNLQMNTKTVHKNQSVKDSTRSSKRSRSSEKCETSSKRFKGTTKKGEMGSRLKLSSVIVTKNNSPKSEQNLRKENCRNSRSSHRKSIERSVKSPSRSRYALPSNRIHDRRSRSISRCRYSLSNRSRRSMSKNLGSDYLNRAQSIASNKRPERETRPKHKSSSLESSPPSTSSNHSESKKENRATPCLSKNLPKPKKSVNEPTSKQNKILNKATNEEHRERTASVNSSLSSLSTVNDLLSKNEPLSFMNWKLSQLDLPVLKHLYESIFVHSVDKKHFHPSDPRFKPYLRRSDSSSIDDNKPHGPQAASTPKIIKRKSKDIKLGDSTQVFSPIKSTNSPVNAKAQK